MPATSTTAGTPRTRIAMLTQLPRVSGSRPYPWQPSAAAPRYRQTSSGNISHAHIQYTIHATVVTQARGNPRVTFTPTHSPRGAP
jgi:hypothetical protein